MARSGQRVADVGDCPALGRRRNLGLHLAGLAIQPHERQRPDSDVDARRGARNVRLFGSVARDEAGPDSDVDFLVDLEPGRSLLDLGGLLMDLQKLMGRKVDVVTETGLRPRLRPRVLREARPL